MQRLRELYQVRFERRQTAAGGALRSEAEGRPG